MTNMTKARELAERLEMQDADERTEIATLERASARYDLIKRLIDEGILHD